VRISLPTLVWCGQLAKQSIAQLVRVGVGELSARGVRFYVADGAYTKRPDIAIRRCLADYRLFAIVKERPTLIKEKTPMTLNHRGSQWGGIAFVFGNILFIVNKLDEMSRLFLSRPMPDVISGQNPGLILSGQVALIIGYIAYYQFYAPRVGGPGRNALRLFSGGGIMLAVAHIGFISALAPYVPSAVRPYVEYLFLLVILGLALLLAGLIWFGILNLRQPVLSRWQWLPLATGLMGFIGFFLFSGENITAVFLFLRTLFALGLIGLGLSLWLERPVRLEMAH
jgi:hypothetical protein